MNKYTSLKLSKLLTDNGFEGESEYHWIFWYGKWKLVDKYYTGGYREKIPAYDILNDLCVKYAKEMFGEELSENTARFDHAGYCTLDNSDNAILQIGTLLRLNEKDEAEEYIWEHCLLNPKNNNND